MEHHHKILQEAEHVWPYVAAIGATIVGMVKMWWSSRKAMKDRITNIEKIAESAVTHQHLAECRDDVGEVDHAILEEIKAIRADMREDNRVNTHAHEKIMNTMIRLHGHPETND